MITDEMIEDGSMNFNVMQINNSSLVSDKQYSPTDTDGKPTVWYRLENDEVVE